MTDDRIKFDYVLCSERIRELREAKKESHATLGNAVSINEQTLKNYEQAALYKGQSTGKDRVTKIAGMNINNLCKLADHFGVSTDYLLGRTNIQTADADIQASCKTTGLSEEALETVVALGDEEKEVLSKLIGAEGFEELLVDISQLHEHAQILDYIFPIVKDPQEKVPEEEKITGNDFALMYDYVRLDKYELKDSFAAIIEEIIPTKEVLNRSKAYMREYGGLSAFAGGKEDGTE